MLAAALYGALQWVVVTGLILIVLLPVLQVVLHAWASGTLDLLPSATASRAAPPAVTVAGATPAETAAILAALGQLRYRLERDAVVIRVTATPCPGCAGEFVPASGSVVVERRVVDRGGLALQATLAHEIGHFVDFTYLTNRDRRMFMGMRGMPAGLDWLSRGLPWRLRPAEDFAEVFSNMTVPTTTLPPLTAYGPVRDPAAVAALLRRAGVRLDGTVPITDIGREVAVEFDLLWVLLSDRDFLALTIVVFIFAAFSGALVEGGDEASRPD